jgi:hypothetical protein
MRDLSPKTDVFVKEDDKSIGSLRSVQGENKNRMDGGGGDTPERAAEDLRSRAPPDG